MAVYYLSPFERYTILYYLSKLLGDIENYKEDIEKIIEDEDFHERVLSEIQSYLLNDTNLPSLKLSSMPRRNQDEEAQNEKEDDKDDKLAAKYFIEKVIKLFDITSNFESKLIVKFKDEQNKPLFESNDLLSIDKSLLNFQKNALIYNKIN